MLAATQVPLWVVVVTGFAGVIAVLLRIAYDRGAEFRMRQIEAAGDFLRTAISIQTAMRELWLPLDTGATLEPPEIDQRFSHLRAARDDQLFALIRLGIFYGERSRTWRAATELDRMLESASGALEVLYNRSTIGGPLSGMRPANGLFTSAVERAGRAFGRVMEAVRDDARQTWIRRRLSQRDFVPASPGWPISPMRAENGSTGAQSGAQGQDPA